MTRVEREELLRRYLEGEMSLEQEHDFIIQVALDKELRHELKAQQTIDRAFRKDRVVDPSAYASLQSAVSAMIAAPVSSAEPVSAVVGTASIYARFLGKGMRRWTLGGIAGLALLGGVLLFGLPDGDEAATSSYPQKAEARVAPPSTMKAVENPSGVSSALQDEAAKGQRQTVTESEPQKASSSSLSSSASPIVRTGSGISRRNISSRSVVLSASADTVQAMSETFPSASAVHPRADSAAVEQGQHPESEDSIGIGVRLLWKK